MDPSHHHDDAGSHHRSRTPFAACLGAGDQATDRSGAVLVPFPAPTARRPRRSPRPGERRGEILLFLGVRYERLAS